MLPLRSKNHQHHPHFIGEELRHKQVGDLPKTPELVSNRPGFKPTQSSSAVHALCYRAVLPVLSPPGRTQDMTYLHTQRNDSLMGEFRQLSGPGCCGPRRNLSGPLTPHLGEDLPPPRIQKASPRQDLNPSA